MAAAAPTALAQAIKEARIRAGSHDKLVAKLKKDYGMSKASRPLAILWEQGTVPTDPGYRTALIDLGVDAELFEPLDPVEYQPAPIAIMQEALENQREMKARLEELEGQVAEVVSLTREALRMLGELRVPGQAATGG